MKIAATFFFLALAFFLGVSSKAETGPTFENRYDRENVVFEVVWLSNWTRPLAVAGDCTGRMKIVGVYSDTTSIEAAVEPDTLLSFVNSLLESDFFNLPEVFPNEKVGLVLKPEGKVGVARTVTHDAGATRVTLYMGELSHTVSLEYPAYGAPAGLQGSVDRLRSLVNRVVQEGN